MYAHKVISVNDMGEIIAQGVTIYGEPHAMLLTSIVNDREPEKNESSSEEAVEIPNQEINKTDLEIMLKNTIDAAFIYHTEGIEEKVRLRFLEAYTQDQWRAKYACEPYRKVLMIEALEGVIAELERLSILSKAESWKILASVKVPAIE